MEWLTSLPFFWLDQQLAHAWPLPPQHPPLTAPLDTEFSACLADLQLVFSKFDDKICITEQIHIPFLSVPFIP